MKKVGLVLMIIGALMVALQALSMIGNARMGLGLELTGDAACDAGFLVGYFFLGVNGLIAFVLGLVFRVKATKHQDDDNE